MRLLHAGHAAHEGESIEGKTCAVSGSGNVALYTIEKLSQLGATVVTASDSNGFIYDRRGIREDRLKWLIDLKENRRGRIADYAEHFPGVEYHGGRKPWAVPCALAFPCATENELDRTAARLVDNGVVAVAEGANMPSTPEAVQVFQRARILFGPAKAANAGGVFVSGLEQSQNAQRISWSRDEVDARLKEIIKNIHGKCVQHGQTSDGYIDYVKGANLAGFLKVADAMLAYGVV